MTSRAVPFAVLVAALGFLSAAVVPAWAEGGGVGRRDEKRVGYLAGRAQSQ